MLLLVIGTTACMAFYFADGLAARGGPLYNAVWRMLMFAGVPLAGLASWSAFSRGGSRLGAGTASLLCLATLLIRVFGDEMVFRDSPALYLPGFAGLVLALVVLSRSRETLGRWGLTMGDWRWWVPRAGVLSVIVLAWVIPAMLLSPEMASYYPSYKPAQTDPVMLGVKVLAHIVDLAGWEMLFRGFLLFGIARRGDYKVAIWLQVIPFFLLHSHKPGIELMLSLPGGLFAGYFCLRARSFVPIFLLHSFQLGSINLLGYAIRNF
ncbi:MAG: CPBP family intramembrane metalloprotease [Myxococcota bacterium]|nr:CPBP family intramembrane metalloprotease [Myxococcota bacterium]